MSPTHKRVTRKHTMPDGTGHLITLSDWRWALLDEKADSHPGGLDAVMANYWERCQIRSQRFDKTTRSRLLEAIIAGDLDDWYPYREKGPRRPPANQNSRPDPVWQVLYGSPKRWADPSHWPTF